MTKNSHNDAEEIKNIGVKEKRRMNPVLKASVIAAAIIAAVLLLIAVIAPVTEAYLYLNPHRNSALSTYPDDMQLGLYYDSYTVHFSDKTVTSAWYIPAQKPDDGESLNFEFIPSEKLIIFSHNYASNRCGEGVNAMWLAKAFVHAGYNVLTFDYSGSGTATGKGYYLGCREKDELCKVIDFAEENPDIHCRDGIVLCGWGYGAASAVAAAPERESVRAVISDSSFDDLDSYLSENGSTWSSLPSFFNGAFKGLCKLISGRRDLLDFSPEDALKNCENKDFLFIHSSCDDIIPPSCSEHLAAAASVNNKAELWIDRGSENSGHLESYLDSENYFSHILDFTADVYAPEQSAAPDTEK